MTNLTFNLLKYLMFTPHSGTRWGLPTVFNGLPGSAKTTVIEAFATEVGLHSYTLSPGSHGEGMFGVVPVPILNATGQRRLCFPPPLFVDAFETAEGGLLFVDEINGADTGLGPALLALMQERRLGDYRFPGRTRVVAARNPEAVAANGKRLSIPLSNRVIHLEWDSPSTDAWLDHELGTTTGRATAVLNPIVEETRVMSVWPAEYGKAVAAVASFRNKMPSRSHDMPDPKTPAAAGPWPSPRSWSLLARAYAGAAIHGIDAATRRAVFAGCVGAGATTEFANYEREVDLPDLGAWLDGTDRWAHNPARIDRSLAVFQGAAALVATMSAGAHRDARRDHLVRALTDAATGGATEVCVRAGRTLRAANLLPTCGPNGEDCDSARCLRALAPALKALAAATGKAR